MAAYELLVELSSGCYDNFELITTQLVSMHHRPDPRIVKEWEVSVYMGRGVGMYRERPLYTHYSVDLTSLCNSE